MQPKSQTNTKWFWWERTFLISVDTTQKTDTGVFLNILISGPPISHSQHKWQDTFPAMVLYFQVASSPGFSSLKRTGVRKLHRFTPKATSTLDDLFVRASSSNAYTIKYKNSKSFSHLKCIELWWLQPSKVKHKTKTHFGTTLKWVPPWMLDWVYQSGVTVYWVADLCA